jgi:sRNA-binding regulator protein Hfq
MSEIIKKRVSESLGKETKIFLHNGYRYAGKITNCDDKYVELLDYKTNSYKIIEIVDISDMEVSQ